MVLNPYTPLSISLKLLLFLQDPDLEEVIKAPDLDRASSRPHDWYARPCSAFVVDVLTLRCAGPVHDGESCVGTAIIILIYVCLAMIVFAHDFRAGFIWLPGELPAAGPLFYDIACDHIGRQYAGSSALGRLAFDHFVTGLVTENDALAEKTLRIAVQSQKEFHVHSRAIYFYGSCAWPVQDSGRS